MAPADRPLVIVGPTASGKSSLALAVAAVAGDVELVSGDSMQVYRHMDIGTAKPSPAERAAVRHHLIDVADPAEDFTVARFVELATAALTGIAARDRRAVLVGGTGLYLQAVVDGLTIPPRFGDVRRRLEAAVDRDGPQALHARLAALDPQAASRIDPANRRRIVRALEVTEGSGRAFSSFGPGIAAFGDTRFRLVGLDRPRPELDERIAARYEQQLAAGFVAEVEHLVRRPEGWSTTASQALGYRELARHVRGELPLAEAVELAVRRTRRFARRQQRWFRRDPRIRWLDPGAVDDNPMAVARELLEDWSRCTSS